MWLGRARISSLAKETKHEKLYVNEKSLHNHEMNDKQSRAVLPFLSRKQRPLAEGP
jgi:hypothetical protein